MRLIHVASLSVLSLVMSFCTKSTHAQTTVQLPSFSSFSYSGSVLVPVGGSTSLGGVSRSATSRSTRWGNRAFSAGHRHSGASVHVTVIDHDAIDRQLRGLSPRERQPPKTAVANNHLTPVRKHTAANPKVSDPKVSDPKVSDPKVSDPKVSDPKVSDPDWEGKALVRYARKQFRARKWDSAFNAYQLAIQALSPSLATLAKAERNRVLPHGPTAPPSLDSQIVRAR